MPSAQPTVVVGGGLSGLATALALQRDGLPVRVLEAAAYPGGTARTVEREGFWLETGPNSVLDRDGTVAAMATSLGLRLQPAASSAARRFVVRAGRLRALPTTPSGFLGSDALPVAAKLRLLLEPLSRRGRPGVDESLEAFALRHFGRAVTATLVDALQTGIWAGDIAQLSAAAAFPRLTQLESAHRSLLLGAIRGRRVAPGGRSPTLASLEGGLGSLSLAMARALGENLQCNSRVTHLSQQGEVWSVTTAQGTLRASQVVLALAPKDVSGLVRPWDLALAESLAAFPTVSVAVVHLGYRPRLQPAPTGFGFLAPSGERRNLLGTVYASSAFPFRAPPDATLLTVLLGGAHRPELLQKDDRDLVATAQSELAALLGVERSPQLTEVFRWPRAIPQYNVGHAERVRAVTTQAGRWPGLWLSGNAYDGAGVPDCLRNASLLAHRLAGH